MQNEHKILISENFVDNNIVVVIFLCEVKNI